MRDIHLHGDLGRKFGAVHSIDVLSAAEAIRALAITVPGFDRALAEGEFALVRGDDVDRGLEVPAEAIDLRLGTEPLHIVPVLAGSKRGGVLKAVAGIALLGLSFGTSAFLTAPIAGGALGAATWGNAFRMVGLSLALGGASQLLAPEVSESSSENENSFILSGFSRAAPEGSGVPIVYGEIIDGDLLISAGLDIDQIGSVDPTVTPSAITDNFVTETT